MAFVYYLLLYPISLLPFRVLYLLSDLMHVVLYRLFSYRVKVVRLNLTNSLPQKSAEEIRQIEQNFYRHLCDLVVESIKAFSISEKQLTQCISHKNPEEVNQYFNQGKHVVMVGGHYNNWELFAVSIGKAIAHQPVALYTPLTNQFMNLKITRSRSKYGLWMKSYAEVKDLFAQKATTPLYAVIFGSDQCPTKNQRPYWMEFLNQETGVQYGTEKFAKEHDLPVVYGVINKIKRGVYEVSYRTVCVNPNELPDGEITQIHTKMLEKDIVADPQYWLWTHKRWKRTRADFDVDKNVSCDAKESNSRLRNNVKSFT